MSEEQPGSLAAHPRDGTRSPRRSRGRQRSNSVSPLVNVLFAIPLVGLVAAGWFIFSQQEQLEGAQQTLRDAERRIGVLEDRLRLTDEQLTESGTQTNETLTFWESEIRKLWDMGNKRNRGWIETNRENLRKLTSTVAGAESSLKTLQGTVATLNASVGRQQEIADRVSAADMQVQRLVRQQRDLVDKVNAASQITAGLKAGLEKRVLENEEAIRAFDAQRSKLNADLVDLRDQIRQIRSPGTSSTPTLSGAPGG